MRIVRARKVDEEIARQRRVCLMCFVIPSQGEMKMLRIVKVVRSGKKTATMIMTKKFWSRGYMDRGGLEDIVFCDSERNWSASHFV